MQKGDRILNYFIVTGASKGLGLELSKILSEADNKVFLISRNKNDEVKRLLESDNMAHFSLNLDNLFEIENTIDEIFESIDFSNAKKIALINNAGMVEPIKPMDKVKDVEIIQNINVNLTAPLILASSFLRKTAAFEGDKRIITVSSGAGKSPIKGWGSYCVSKCGVDMMTRVIALEQGENGAKCLSFGPGIMDTAMQETIRSADENDFEDLEKFKEYKSEGKLLEPKVVAQVLYDLLYTESDFEQGGIVSVRDFIENS